MRDKLSLAFSAMLIIVAVTDYILESYNFISMIIIILAAIVIFLDRKIILNMEDANCVNPVVEEGQ